MLYKYVIAFVTYILYVVDAGYNIYTKFKNAPWRKFIIVPSKEAGPILTTIAEL